jgi:hypothetical protein
MLRAVGKSGLTCYSLGFLCPSCFADLGLIRDQTLDPLQSNPLSPTLLPSPIFSSHRHSICDLHQLLICWAYVSSLRLPLQFVLHIALRARLSSADTGQPTWALQHHLLGGLSGERITSCYLEVSRCRVALTVGSSFRGYSLHQVGHRDQVSLGAGIG